MTGVDAPPDTDTTVQAYAASVRPAAAALAEPSSVSVRPAPATPSTRASAAGRRAAITAASVSSMPAPHTCVLQMHSYACSPAVATSWQAGGCTVAPAL